MENFIFCTIKYFLEQLQKATPGFRFITSYSENQLSGKVQWKNC